MSGPPQEQQERANRYAELYGVALSRQLGFGNDGVVWATESNSVVKAIFRNDTYERERSVYLRLYEAGIKQLAGFNVPKLLNYHNQLLIIEMEVVFPPFIVDFGKAYLDRLPDYPENALEEWYVSRAELFSAEQWPSVCRLLAALRGLGIYYLDPTPANIKFAGTSPDE
jgi:hypothetical protein